MSVRNAGRRWLRDRQGRETGVDVEELSAEEEERVERAEREARLWDWVDALPERQREVLLAVKQEGLSYKEIAASLGVSERTVASHLRRAVSSLRRAAVKVYLFFFG